MAIKIRGVQQSLTADQRRKFCVTWKITGDGKFIYTTLRSLLGVNFQSLELIEQAASGALYSYQLRIRIQLTLILMRIY